MGELLTMKEDLLLLETLTEILDVYGHPLIQAKGDGEERVEVFAKTDSDSKLCDVNMSKVGGFEVLEKLKTLERIIGQKEVLIVEVNHRVKNNMSVIIGLINLQKQKTKDAYHSELLEEIKGKVYSMSMIQEQLQDNGNVEIINLGSYLESLVTNLNISYGQEKSIEINLEMEKVRVDVSKATPCGLIANEILTNSFKYAFNDQNQFPKLGISLKQTDNTVELTFSDNGLGFDLNSPQVGTGLELIKDLSEQIGASVSFNVEKGVLVKLLFPIS